MQYEFGDIEFDSPEEKEFHAWCQEAQAVGIITEFKYQPATFTLADKVAIPMEEVYYTPKRKERKVRIKERHVFHRHVYTPDFSIVPAKLELLQHPLLRTGDVYWIDVKGSFSIHNDEKPFSIDQKWMYQKHDIIINKVVTDKFFTATWVPIHARMTPKTGVVRKKYQNVRTVDGISELFEQ